LNISGEYLKYRMFPQRIIAEWQRFFVETPKNRDELQFCMPPQALRLKAKFKISCSSGNRDASQCRNQ